MKQNKMVSFLGALMIVSAALFMTNCNTPTNSGSGKNQNQGNTGSQNNNADNTKVKATGKADPVLKDTHWLSDTPSANISFNAETNIVNINDMDATYSVDGLTVSFDLTQYVQIHKAMTAEQYIKEQTAERESKIAELEKELKEAQTEAEKKNIQEELADKKKRLEAEKNALKPKAEAEAAKTRQAAATLEPIAKFTGMLNDAKTMLTIEKLPVLPKDATAFKQEKVVTKKR